MPLRLVGELPGCHDGPGPSATGLAAFPPWTSSSRSPTRPAMWFAWRNTTMARATAPFRAVVQRESRIEPVF